MRHRGGGVRPWSQFLRFIERLALQEGSAIWAAKLSDDNLIKQLWEEYRKDRRLFDTIEERRPALYGFTRQQAMLTGIANTLNALRIEANPAASRAIKMFPTPIFPMEAVELRWRDLAKGKRETGIEVAQAKWARMYEETGVKPNG